MGQEARGQGWTATYPSTMAGGGGSPLSQLKDMAILCLALVRGPLSTRHDHLTIQGTQALEGLRSKHLILKGNPQRLRWEHLLERTRKLAIPLPPSLQREAEGCRGSGRGLPRGSINSFPANRFFRTGLWISLPTSFFKPDSCGADGGDSPAWENTD